MLINVKNLTYLDKYGLINTVYEREGGGGGGYEQQSRRPACTSTQTDQSLYYSLFGKYYI